MDKITPTKPAKITFKNIKKFIQGHIRSMLLKLSNNKFVSKFSEDLKILEPHQVEQYKWRLTIMNPQCLNTGHCVICGCETPYLQMADESCDGKCYPEMMSKEEWQNYKETKNIN